MNQKVKNNKQKAFVVPLVVFLVTIIAALGAVYLFSSTQHRRNMMHFSQRERAYHFAQSSLNLTCNVVNEFLEYYNSRNANDFKNPSSLPLPFQLFSSFFSTDGLLKASRVSFSGLTPDVQRFIKNEKDLSLDVEVVFEKAIPLYSGSSGAIKFDERETNRLLKITATAKVGPSTVESVAYKEFRHVNIQPPVVGRFSFFVRDKGFVNAKPNCGFQGRGQQSSYPTHFK